MEDTFSCAQEDHQQICRFPAHSTAQYQTNVSTVRKLLFNRWRWLPPCWLFIKLCAGRHLADRRGCASQLFASIGRQLGCYNRIHPQYDLDQLISQPQIVSWYGRISWPWPIGTSEGSTGPWYDSVGCYYSSPGPAVHYRSPTRTTRGLGLWWIPERHYRRGCACGRAIDAHATLRRNTRPRTASSRQLIPTVRSAHHTGLVKGASTTTEDGGRQSVDGGRVICIVRMIHRQLTRLGQSADSPHHLLVRSVPRVAHLFFPFCPSASFFLSIYAFLIYRRRLRVFLNFSSSALDRIIHAIPRAGGVWVASHSIIKSLIGALIGITASGYTIGRCLESSDWDHDRISDNTGYGYRRTTASPGVSVQNISFPF